MNSINNNINFKAKLDVSEIKSNTKRWKKIAKEFQAQTKNYPDDEFVISDDDFYGIYFARTKNGKFEGIDWSEIKRPLFEKLEQLSDSELVNKLKKMFYIQRKIDNLQKESSKLLYKYGFLKSNAVDLVDDFNRIIYKGQDALIERHLKNDKFLYANKKDIHFDF